MQTCVMGERVGSLPLYHAAERLFDWARHLAQQAGTGLR